MKQLSSDLGLEFEPQDWGIINASPERIWEFIRFFEHNPNLEDPMKYQLFELIIASFNDALVENSSNEETEADFVSFLKKESGNKTFQPILEYWRSIEGEENPVGRYL